MSSKFNFPDEGFAGINWTNSDGSPGAKQMIEKYLCHPNRILTSNNEPLEYIRIKLNDVQQLLGMPTTDEQKEVLLFFGVSIDDLDEPDASKQDFTLIMASAECVDGNLSVKTEPVFNKFDPCPDKCLQYAEPTHRPSRAVDGEEWPC